MRSCKLARMLQPQGLLPKATGFDFGEVYKTYYRELAMMLNVVMIRVSGRYD
ncbi:MAG: hypothetical protein ACM37W_14600 [Actinomycetota bacterium]